VAAYLLIGTAHLLNALPENPTDVIAEVIALRRRHMTDELASAPAAAESAGHVASTHLQQPPTRRVAPASTVLNIAVEHNNK